MRSLYLSEAPYFSRASIKLRVKIKSFKLNLPPDSPLTGVFVGAEARHEEHNPTARRAASIFNQFHQEDHRE